MARLTLFKMVFSLLARRSGVAEGTSCPCYPVGMAAVPQQEAGEAAPEKAACTSWVESQCGGSQAEDSSQKGLW